MNFIKNLFLTKLEILITILLIFQVWFINYYQPDNEIQIDPLIMLKRENYINNLENKFEKLKQSGFYDKLKTNILFTKNTTVETTFTDKDKVELTNAESFNNNTFINLYYYHQNYINPLFMHTKNIMITESFISMMNVIEDISNKNVEVFSNQDREKISELSKTFKAYVEDMNKNITEIEKFDKKIEEIYGINPYSYKINELDLQGEINKFELLLNMFTKTNYLFINIPKDSFEDPFLKFNTFVNIYDTSYNLYKSLIEKYNKNIKKQEEFNKLILSIISILILILTFIKERKKNDFSLSDIK